MSKTQQQAQQTSHASTQTQSTQPLAESNAQKAQNLRSEEGTAEGLLNYEQALGSWLGGELYDAVAPHLSHSQIGSYAEKGLDSLVDALKSYLLGVEGDVDPEVIRKLFTQIDSDIDGIADDFVKDQGAGLVNTLGGWVDAHPRMIVGVAILAAIGAYLADMDIPTLSQRFKLGEGLTAKLSANIGSLQNITLQKISAQLEYKSGLLVAAVKVNRTSEGTSATLSGKYGEEGQQVKGNVEVDEDGLKAYATEGELVLNENNSVHGRISGGRETQGTNISLEVKREDGSSRILNNIQYNTSTGLISSSEINEQEWMGGTLRSENQFNSEGGSSSLGWSGNINDQTTLDAKTTQSLSGRSIEAKTVHTQDDFKTELDLRFHDQNGSSAAGRFESKMTNSISSRLSMSINSDGLYTQDSGLTYDNNNGLTAGVGFSSNNQGDYSASGNIDYVNGSHSLGASTNFDLSNSEISELRAYYNFSNDKSFNSFLAEYRYNLDPVAQHNFDLTIQRELFDMRWRFVEKMQYDDQNGLSTNTSLLGAKALNSDYSLIGGMRHEYSGGEHNVLPQLGIQYKDIPIVLEFDPKTNGAAVRLELKF